MRGAWTPLHAGHAAMPVEFVVLAVVAAVAVSLVLRSVGVTDWLSGRFVAGDGPHRDSVDDHEGP